MTLYEYLSLMGEGEELTVWDKDYDMETYFYSDRPDDEDDNWSRSAWKLSEKLSITKISTNGVIVNLSDVIEKNIDKLKEMDLFIDCDIDSIMEDIHNILAGNVSKEWMEKFVVTLE